MWHHSNVFKSPWSAHVWNSMSSCLFYHSQWTNDYPISGIRQFMMAISLHPMGQCASNQVQWDCLGLQITGIILCMHPANERWRYSVMPSPIGWVHTQDDPWDKQYHVYSMILLLVLHHQRNNWPLGSQKINSGQNYREPENNFRMKIIYVEYFHIICLPSHSRKSSGSTWSSLISLIFGSRIN